MGLVYKYNSGQIDPNNNLVRHYPSGTAEVSDALVTPGQPSVVVKVAEVDAEEVKSLLQKIDAIANSYMNEAVAVAYAESFPVILTAMRMVKEEAKAPFRGILASGTELDAAALIPQFIGSTKMASTTTSTGLYGGTGNAVFTWLSSSLTAGTSDDLVPEQTMSQYAAVVHIGAMDTVAVPKINRVLFTLSGIPSPAQSTQFDIRGVNGTTPFVRFHKPILVGPLKKQKIDVDPNIAGYTKFQLMSIIIARADVLDL